MSGAEPPRNRGLIIPAQTREMARLVLKMCNKEKYTHPLNIDIDKPLKRAAQYTGLSIKTLRSILKEGDESNGKFSSTGTTKSKPSGIEEVFDIDDFDRHSVHRCIEMFYLEKRSVPYLSSLHQVFKEKFAFPWQRTTLKKMLTKMGYSKQFRNIAENPSIASARKQYLEKIREYRQRGRNIFYVDETWFDLNVPFKKYWRLALENAIMTDVTAEDRLVLIHAGSKDGFLKGAQWLFEVGVTQGEYQVQMSKENFELWVTQLLIAKLPPRSVVVMDSASYHNELLNDVPTSNSSKEEMYTWLMNNTDYTMPIENIHDIDKEILYNMIDVSKSDKTTKYKIDHILNCSGHDVLRLPLHMAPEFSPIMFAWEKIAGFVKEKMKSIESSNKQLKYLNIKALQLVVESSISLLKDSDWREFDQKVKTMEEVYWIRDRKMEQAMKQINPDDLEGNSDSDKSDEFYDE